MLDELRAQITVPITDAAKDILECIWQEAIDVMYTELQMVLM
jgi:hypothetical protein